MKQWIVNKWPKDPSKRFVPLSVRVKLSQNTIFLEDGRSLSVRVANVDDVEALLEIQRHCYGGKTPWNRSALLHEIRYNRNAFYLLVQDADRGVAFIGAWFVHSEAHITNIATIPEYQQNGIASFLICQLIEIARSEQVTILSLECRVSNVGAQRLYRKLGFIDGRLKKGYYANNHEDALEMKMNLVENVLSQEEREEHVSSSGN